LLFLLDLEGDALGIATKIPQRGTSEEL